ncbi:uncharacterized protein LOC121188153 isoform X2 [Toxotes jaculatrix]|uniref:uncharacterized protein LOC121188153 isoform X2 n=1 Tax=Toxotes jaculatrix TaxID=941984 RepID=UPI001B3ACE5C|nr:uncharacterized protein LOC121188153 isoform X2 [Toxotes jaculatrix]
MTGGLAALILLSTLSLTQTTDVPCQTSLTVAEVGDNLTLTCPDFGKEIGLFYWYKMNFAQKVQTVASGTFDKIMLKGQFANPRFSFTKMDDHYSLIIRNVSKEDEATYLCQAGTAYEMEFIKGTIVNVNDRNQQKHVYVKQSPEKASVQLGDSVTLQCSLLSKNKENRVQCPGEHSVHWFRSGSGGFHPGIIYTHSSRRDEQEGRSCVYSLSKTMQNSSDAGTYYCAVVTCGEILFGEGTKVETGDVFSHAEHDRSAEDQPSFVHLQDGEAEALNYVALDFTSRKAKRWKNNRESPQECLYSGMRDYQ